MSKKYYRFFGGLLTAQEHWLNKMSEKGYRLIRAEKMLYEFEECEYSARDCAPQPLKLSIHSGGIEHPCRCR